MCQCQKRRNECFHVCMQLVLNPCTHHKFRKWWLLICTARNSLVVSTCLQCGVSVYKKETLPELKHGLKYVHTSPRPCNTATCPCWELKRVFVFGCSNSMLENTIHLLIYMAYVLSEIYISINWIWSDLIQSSLTCLSLSNRSINFYEHTYLHAYLSISSSICISVYHLI